jgi:hypothetical protein
LTAHYPFFGKYIIVGDMTIDVPFATIQPSSDRACQQIEVALDEISQLAKSDLPVRDFHQQLLERVTAVLTAAAGAVWLVDDDGRMQTDCQISLDQVLPAGELVGQQHRELLREVIQLGTIQLVPLDASTSPLGHPCSNALVVCPLVLPGRTLGVIEVFLRAHARPDVQQGCLQIVAAVGELATDFHRDKLLRELTAQRAWWQQWRTYSQMVHGTLALKATAYTIVNEGRRLVGCDRVSLAVRRGRRCRLVAVSGVDEVQRRATVVGQLETLATRALKSQQPLRYPDQAGELPPDLETVLEAYLDDSSVRWLACIPLGDPSRDRRAVADWLGVLMIEQFDGAADAEVGDRIAAVCGPATTALRSAIEHESVPLLPFWRYARRAAQCIQLDRLPRTLLIAALVATAAGALLLPADFEIPARGDLQPAVRRQVFAPEEGLVVALPKAAGAVNRGETLAVLSNPQLDQQYADVAAKRRTTEEQLTAVRTARRRQQPTARNDERYVLSGQEQQLQERLSGLEQQARLLAEQRRQLTVASPIDGQILTWDLERLLAARPVQRGERLMTVADLNGPWELRLRIDDRSVGHVLAAQQESGLDLEVSFLLATDPNTRYRGRIGQMGSAIELDDAGQAALSALVPLNAGQVPQPRPGAAVVARIHCGRRPLGYVWFRQVIEFIQSRLLF